MRRRRPLVAPASRRLPRECRRAAEESPRRGLQQGHRQAHPAPVAGRAAAVPPRPAGERRRDPQQGRGLPHHDGGGLQAALLRGPRTSSSELGIEIRSDEDPLSETSSELYSLPADAYYLEPVELDGDEVTALAACLAVLEDRFAYSQPLRLALLSLAQGRPELLAEAEAPPLTVVPEAHEPAAALPKLQAAVAERKTVEFAYYAISRDEEIERDRRPLRPAAGRRRVVPHRLVPPARGPAHLPPLAHPLARQAPHPPAARLRAAGRTSTSRAYRDRPAWQLAEPRGTARVRVSPAMAWWVEAHWAHCGTVEQLDDGGIVYETPYADARPLLGWVLGLADEAELLEPADLRAQLRGQLDALAALLDAPAARAAVPACSGRAGRPAPAAPARPRPARGGRPVHAAHRAHQLPAAPLQGRRGARSTSPPCAPTWASSAEELRDDVRLLNLVNFGGDGRCSTRSSRAAAGCACSATWRGRRWRAPPASHRSRRTRCCWRSSSSGTTCPPPPAPPSRAPPPRSRRVRGGAPALVGRRPAAAGGRHPHATSTAPSSSGVCSPSSTGPRARTA